MHLGEEQMKRMGLWERGTAVVRMGGFDGGWLSLYLFALFFFSNDSDYSSIKKIQVFNSDS